MMHQSRCSLKQSSQHVSSAWSWGLYCEGRTYGQTVTAWQFSNLISLVLPCIVLFGANFCEDCFWIVSHVLQCSLAPEPCAQFRPLCYDASTLCYDASTQGVEPYWYETIPLAELDATIQCCTLGLQLLLTSHMLLFSHWVFRIIESGRGFAADAYVKWPFNLFCPLVFWSHCHSSEPLQTSEPLQLQARFASQSFA